MKGQLTAKLREKFAAKAFAALQEKDREHEKLRAQHEAKVGRLAGQVQLLQRQLGKLERAAEGRAGGGASGAGGQQQQQGGGADSTHAESKQRGAQQAQAAQAEQAVAVAVGVDDKVGQGLPPPSAQPLPTHPPFPPGLRRCAC
jgi:hypothetical protein